MQAAGGDADVEVAVCGERVCSTWNRFSRSVAHRLVVAGSVLGQVDPEPPPQLVPRQLVGRPAARRSPRCRSTSLDGRGPRVGDRRVAGGEDGDDLLDRDGSPRSARYRSRGRTRVGAAPGRPRGGRPPSPDRRVRAATATMIRDCVVRAQQHHDVRATGRRCRRTSRCARPCPGTAPRRCWPRRRRSRTGPAAGLTSSRRSTTVCSAADVRLVHDGRGVARGSTCAGRGRRRSACPGQQATSHVQLHAGTPAVPSGRRVHRLVVIESEPQPQPVRAG